MTEALEILGEASTFADETGEGFWLAAIFRLRGELLATIGDVAGAETELARAVRIAQQQGAETLDGPCRRGPGQTRPQLTERAAPSAGRRPAHRAQAERSSFRPENSNVGPAVSP